ncbi:NAD(P)-dependent alcohol dehydrogenase [Rhodococcus sp. (in: high G+C Gram-positive bacteria)]|uniref:NAD(P)-dependent alcohol dehydrogenase n=1 Tax=Rhodococcus sp. TaxID=1831 RepID=UPI00257AB0B3|nr:NAD(P)-dependent alcohol dehydrogenase [Rhodococcus sp. (in: high G+C Gram-positive bacteria)]MBQ7805729.1 NAD(P)-dependent alcohol dehydrogenase [Rhodococcus sp. (in: high G+C Gram-positive bacteria)]
MKAVQMTAPGRLELREVGVPDVGPDGVLVKIAGAGVCHSDLHVLHMEQLPLTGFTMGHEGAGWVEKVGTHVVGFEPNDPVLVTAGWSCGRCRACVEGRDNVCQVTGSRMQAPTIPGLGPDGAMAEYILVDARHLVKLGDLDPVTASPLADAGLTPMGAINSARNRLTPDSTAVVIGLGGLGNVALQILRATSGARIIGVDIDQGKLTIAEKIGIDDLVLANADTAAYILDATGGYGADAVFDFVGVQNTVDLAISIIAPAGALRFIGLGGGRFSFGSDFTDRLPWQVNTQLVYGGSRTDQLEVIELARRGRVVIDVQRYPLADFQTAFADLESGRVVGRAVLVP